MKTFSYSQQQLLKVLQIGPLELIPAFSAETAIDPLVETENRSEPLPAADLASELAQDIYLALPEGVSWHIDQHILSAEFKDKQLITPALSALQQAELKQALWQLLSALHED